MYERWKAMLPVAAAALALAGSMPCVPASAQPVSPSVGVVRATGDAMQALADAVDAALLRDLAGIAGIDSPVVSPIDYAEIELGVGCFEPSRDCLLAIARAVRVEALVVRRLSVDAEGHGRLELTYFEGASTDAPATVDATAPAAQMQSELVGAVPALVRRLFGIADIAEPAAPAPVPTTALNVPQTAPVEKTPPATDDETGVSAATWIAFGAGAAALTAGAIVGWTAQEDFRDWKERPIRSRDEADDARAKFDGIQSRAIGADVLLALGALGVGLGVTLLVLDLGRSTERDHAQLVVAPTPDGAIVRIDGTLQDAF
jgi:hypothetical protein